MRLRGAAPCCVGSDGCRSHVLVQACAISRASPQLPRFASHQARRGKRRAKVCLARLGCIAIGWAASPPTNLSSNPCVLGWRAARSRYEPFHIMLQKSCILSHSGHRCLYLGSPLYIALSPDTTAQMRSLTTRCASDALGRCWLQPAFRLWLATAPRAPPAGATLSSQRRCKCWPTWMC